MLGPATPLGWWARVIFNEVIMLEYARSTQVPEPGPTLHIIVYASLSFPQTFRLEILTIDAST